MKAEYNRRRLFVYDELTKMGLPCVKPQGAFYIFPDIRSTGLTDNEFAEGLLAAERIAVVPGSAFGEQGKGHVRISYASSMENLAEAMKRIARFIASKK